MIGIAATEGITLGVLSPLQHKLLSLVGGVLVTHPAVDEQETRVNNDRSVKACPSLVILLSVDVKVCLFLYASVSSLTLRSPP